MCHLEFHSVIGIIPLISSQWKFLLPCSPSQPCFNFIVFFSPRGKFLPLQVISTYFCIPTKSQNHQCDWHSLTSTLPHLETFPSHCYSNSHHFFPFWSLCHLEVQVSFPFLFLFLFLFPAILPSSSSLLRYNLYIIKQVSPNYTVKIFYDFNHRSSGYRVNLVTQMLSLCLFPQLLPPPPPKGKHYSDFYYLIFRHWLPDLQISLFVPHFFPFRKLLINEQLPCVKT